MSGNLQNGIVVLSEVDKGELAWWCAHHKGNVAYLATRIKQLVENPDDEKYKEFFYKHFQATVNDFLKSVYPILNPQTKELVTWEESEHYGKASSDELEKRFESYPNFRGVTDGE